MERMEDWGIGRQGETGKEKREGETESDRRKVGLCIFLNCFHEFSALFPQPANLLITQYIYLKSVSYP